VKKSAVAAAFLGATALFLSACGSAPEEAADTPTSEAPATSAAAESQAAESQPAASDTFLACMVSDAGGFEDKSFNQSGYEGLVRAVSELGVEKKQAESKDGSDFAPNLEAMVAEGCGLTITVGYLLAEATQASAEANPNSNFAIVDDNSITLPNVKSLVFKTSDAAFLAGYLAAGYTDSGTVATFGGMNIPSVSIFMDGFVDGVAKYNEDNGTSVTVLGWDKDKQDGTFAGGFEDQTVGKNTTQTFIDQGADIIFPVAGPVGLGAMAAAKEAGGVSVIWVDADGYLTNPDYSDIILTSVVKEIGAAVFDTVKEASEGNFSGSPYIGTLVNGGVGISPYHDYETAVPEELKAKIEELKQQIIDGTLVVTSPNDPQQ
jgi:basic membrane protein A